MWKISRRWFLGSLMLPTVLDRWIGRKPVVPKAKMASHGLCPQCQEAFAEYLRPAVYEPRTMTAREFYGEEAWEDAEHFGWDAPPASPDEMIERNIMVRAPGNPLALNGLCGRCWPKPSLEWPAAVDQGKEARARMVKELHGL